MLSVCFISSWEETCAQLWLMKLTPDVAKVSNPIAPWGVKLTIYRASGVIPSSDYCKKLSLPNSSCCLVYSSMKSWRALHFWYLRCWIIFSQALPCFCSSVVACPRQDKTRHLHRDANPYNLAQLAPWARYMQNIWSDDTSSNSH